MSDEQVWARSPSVAQVGDQARVALIDLEDPAHPPRILTGPAAAVWQAMDGERDVVAVCRHVAADFSLTPEDVAADVRAFLTGLSTDGLIVEVDPGSGHDE